MRTGPSASMRAPMRRTDFHFDLPDALIARHPAPQRSGSRLLHLEGATGALTDRQFRDLPGLLRRGDLLVLNDTRVIPARLHGHRGFESTLRQRGAIEPPAKPFWSRWLPV